MSWIDIIGIPSPIDEVTIIALEVADKTPPVDLLPAYSV